MVARRRRSAAETTRTTVRLASEIRAEMDAFADASEQTLPLVIEWAWLTNPQIQEWIQSRKETKGEQS